MLHELFKTDTHPKLSFIPEYNKDLLLRYKSLRCSFYTEDYIFSM